MKIRVVLMILLVPVPLPSVLLLNGDGRPGDENVVVVVADRELVGNIRILALVVSSDDDDDDNDDCDDNGLLG